MVKNSPAMKETQSPISKVQSWVGKIPWRREWLPTPIFLPGAFQGKRSLAGYSPWGHTVGHDGAAENSTQTEGEYKGAGG